MLVLFRRFGAGQFPRLETVSIDVSALAYTFGLIALCSVISGVLPALLQREGLAVRARGGEGPYAQRTRCGLVIAEIALAVAVVASAGLITRSYVALTHVPVGFDARGAVC